MEYRNLGRSGLRVSELCLGTMQFGWTADERTSLEVLEGAYEAGVNFFDTADIYSRWIKGNEGGVSEQILGRWMAEAQIPRERVVLATKVRGPMGSGPNEEGLSRKHIFEAIEDSLARLGTEYVDLYQLHFPDDDTPIAETLSALDDLVRAGRVRYIGCSNFTAWQLVEALWVSDVGGFRSFVSLQPHYNLVHREEFEGHLQTVCERYGLGVLPYSPLAGGFLTEKYSRGDEAPEGSRGASSSRVQAYLRDESKWRIRQELESLGSARGKSVSQLALGWLLSLDSVSSPIIGPRNLAQLDDNLGAVGLRLTEEEMAQLDAVSAARGAQRPDV